MEDVSAAFAAICKTMQATNKDRRGFMQASIAYMWPKPAIIPLPHAADLPIACPVD
jgi:hypothetical protein